MITFNKFGLVKMAGDESRKTCLPSQNNKLAKLQYKFVAKDLGTDGFEWGLWNTKKQISAKNSDETNNGD